MIKSENRFMRSVCGKRRAKSAAEGVNRRETSVRE